MTKDTALRMAIEVFDMYGNKMNSAFADEAYQACKDALAETQEATEQAPCEQPVAWQALCVGNHYAYATAKLDLTGYHSDFWQRPLYTTPPSHEWVGLSDRELFNLSQQCNLNHILGLIDYGRAIESKLKEKNG